MPLRRRSKHTPSRRDIAHAAARLINDGNAPSFAAAKRKAADQLGLGTYKNLPENREVQAALIAYQQLYDGDAHSERIAAMRGAALTAMQALADFRPRLVGPVLYGSACDYSPITVHVYTDEVERLARHFLDRNIEYKLDDTVLAISKTRREAFPTYIIDDDFEFQIVAFPETYYSHPPLSSLDGRPFQRLDSDGVRALIDEGVAQSPG